MTKMQGVIVLVEKNNLIGLGQFYLYVFVVCQDLCWPLYWIVYKAMHGKQLFPFKTPNGAELHSESERVWVWNGQILNY